MVSRLLGKLRRRQWGLWDLRTVWIDQRYGGHVGGRTETRFGHLGAKATDNIAYRVVSDAMTAVSVSPEDVLVDVGCGRGRVLNWWLSRGLRNRLVGIEIDPDIAAEVRHRLRGFPNVEILTGDAVDLTPPEASICFLYHPFQEPLTRIWRDAVVARQRAPRLTILYVNPQCLDAMRESGEFRTRMLPKSPGDYAEIAVLTRDLRS
jgi:SAM-dependent methyltransferase